MSNMSDHNRLYKVLITIAVLAVLLITLYITHKNFLNVYIMVVLRTEVYSYILIAIPVSIAVLYKLAINYFEIEGLNILRLVGSITLFLFSVLFHVLGDIIDEFFLELKVLSLVCLFLLSLTLFFRPKSVSISYLSIALLLTFVPIPRQAIDFLSPTLTRAITSIVSAITSTHVIEFEGMLVLLVKDAAGVDHLFKTESIYGGVASVLSILTISPSIIYFALTSPAPKTKKIVYTAASIAIAVATVFVGNLLRLTLTIELTKHIGYDAALKFFNYTPPIIYVALATFLAIYTAIRLLSMPKIGKHDSSTTIRFVKPPPSLYLALAIYVTLLVAYNVVAPLISMAMLTQFSVSVSGLPQLLEKPATATLNSSNVLTLHSIPGPKISEALSVPDVRSISLNYSGTQFVGYIEIADTPTKFHGWYVCVTLQGFGIEKSWVEVSNTTIHHMIISKDISRLLLSYTVYRLILPEGVAYVRLSIMTPITEADLQERLERARDVIGNVRVVSDSTPHNVYIFDALVVSVNMFTAISIALLTLYIIGRSAEQKGIKILVGGHM